MKDRRPGATFRRWADSGAHPSPQSGRWIVAGLVLFLAVSGWGATFSEVSFKSGDESITAAWAAPEGAGPFPAVILVHEWWGLNDWVKQKGEELLKHGFAVLAVDLYRGRVTADPDEAHELMRGLPDDRAIRDLAAAVDYVRGLPAARDRKIGVMGWCMGGGLALKLAIAHQDLSACVVYYGSLPTDRAALNQIPCPVIGFFGAEDRGIPIKAVTEFEQTMLELNKQVTVKIYERAGHAFLNETRPSYNKAAATDSWKRAVTFLSNHLKTPR